MYLEIVKVPLIFVWSLLILQLGYMYRINIVIKWNIDINNLMLKFALGGYWIEK